MPWDNPPSNFSEEYRKRHSDLARELSIRVLRGVIIRSPVDTGRFRGNWQVAEGSRPSGNLDTTQPSVNGALSQSIGGIPTDMSNTVLYIVNNLPYAERLENGWSDQAPNGMVAITLLEVEEWLRRQR